MFEEVRESLWFHIKKLYNSTAFEEFPPKEWGWKQILSLRNVPIWHKNYFELKVIIETQQIQEKLFNFSLTAKITIGKAACTRKRAITFLPKKHIYKIGQHLFS